MTFFFYLCDYFYVRYTRIYRWSFFIYSCVFLVGLFITLAAIQTNYLQARRRIAASM